MLTVPQEVFGSLWTGEQEREDVLIRLLHVASGAGENEVVTTIVRAFSFAGRHVIERDSFYGNVPAAVCTHWSVPVEKPLAGVSIRVAACG